MKKTLIAAIALLLITTLVFSQTPAPRGRKSKSAKPKTTKQDPKLDDLFIEFEKTYVPPDERLFEDWEYKQSGWRLVAIDASGSGRLLIYRDRYRVKRDGIRSAQVWLRIVDEANQTIGNYDLHLKAYNCSGETFRTVAIFNYDKNGKQLSERHPEPKWNYIVPDTVEEKISNIVCYDLDDLEDTEMRTAAREYRDGRQHEKKGELSTALWLYERAAERLPRNEKILGAIQRVKPNSTLKK